MSFFSCVFEDKAFDGRERIVYNSEYCGSAGKRFVMIIQFDKMGEYKEV